MDKNDSKFPDSIVSTLLDAQHDSSKPPPIWFSKRFLVSMLLFLGMIIYSMECLMSTIAVVEMTTAKQIIVAGNTTVTQPPEYQWDSITIGIILNMFWYGFLFSPAGGTLSQKFGGSVTLGLSMMATGVITLFAPISLQRWNLYAFLANRGLVGVLEGFFSASIAAVFSSWVPKKERPAFMSIILNGAYIGAAIIYPICGFVAYYWGWAFWFDTTFFIPQVEQLKSHIQNEYPFKDILSSVSFWALSISKFAFGWGTTFVSVYFPLYIGDKTNINIKDVGFLSSVPHIFNIILIPVAGILMGYWQNHSSLKITQIHKIIISVAFIACSLLYAVIPFTDGFFVANMCFVGITILISYNKVVLELITVNMAPNHSSLVSGLSLCCQTVGFIMAQCFTGFIVKNHRMDEWNICFFVSAGVLISTAVMFIFYGSSEPQYWSISLRNVPDTSKIT